MPTITDQLEKLKRLLKTDGKPKYADTLDGVTGTTSSEIYYEYKRILHLVAADPEIRAATKTMAQAIKAEIDRII